MNQNREQMTEIKKLQDENNNIKQQLNRMDQELQKQKENSTHKDGRECKNNGRIIFERRLLQKIQKKK